MSLRGISEAVPISAMTGAVPQPSWLVPAIGWDGIAWRPYKITITDLQGTQTKYGGTSATVLTIGAGSKSLSTQAGLAYLPGARVRASSNADTSKFMEGVVTAYNVNSGAMTILVDSIGGVGSAADWNLNLAGNQGSQGNPGTNGANGTNGLSYGGSSTTSLLIGTGAKAFTTQAGLAYLPSNYVRASSAANGANFMEGFVTSYNPGTGALNLNVTKVGGAGTLADWNLSISGAPGTGDLLSTNNLSDVANAGTARTNLGLAIGTNVQAFDADLSTLANLGNWKIAYTDGSGVQTALGFGSAGTLFASNGAASAPGFSTPATLNIPQFNLAQAWSKPQSNTVNALSSGVGGDWSSAPIMTANVNGSTFTVTNPGTDPADKSIVGLLVTFTTNNTLAFGNKFKVTGYTQGTSGKDMLWFYFDSGAALYYLIGVRNNVTA